MPDCGRRRDVEKLVEYESGNTKKSPGISALSDPNRERQNRARNPSEDRNRHLRAQHKEPGGWSDPSKREPGIDISANWSDRT